MCRILYKRHTERGSHAAQLTVYKRRHFVSAEQGPGRTLVFLRKCFPALNWNTLAHAHIQYTHAYSTYMPECIEIKAHRRFNTDQRTCTINRQKTNKQNKTKQQKTPVDTLERGQRGFAPLPRFSAAARWHSHRLKRTWERGEAEDTDDLITQ